jgi:predicted secreted protein
MIRAATLALCLLLAGPAAADTLLHLSEYARVMVRPDELVAMLRAQAVAASAAEAQAQVNTAMAGALASARQTAGVTVATGAYSVWPQNPPAHGGRQEWRATQTLELHSGDGVALLTLVGTLQQRGLAVGQLAWRLAPETARKARAEALRQALSGLRARADEAASILGLRFDSFRDVRLGQAVPMPRPMMFGARAPAAAQAPPPPVAEAEEVPIETSVEAEVVLK